MIQKNKNVSTGAACRLAFDRRSIVIGVGLGAVGGLSLFRTPKPLQKPISPNSFRDGIPSQVAGWTSRRSTEIVLPALDEGDKIYENIETRIYEGQGLPSIMFLIAFSSVQFNNIQVHRPEVCYSVAGYPIIWTKPTLIDIKQRRYQGRELAADRNGLNERIIYFVRVADKFATTWPQQRIAMAQSYLAGKIPDGVLFRVSMFEQPGQDPSPILRDFISEFSKAVNPQFLEKIIL